MVVGGVHLLQPRLRREPRFRRKEHTQQDATSESATVRWCERCSVVSAASRPTLWTYRGVSPSGTAIARLERGICTTAKEQQRYGTSSELGTSLWNSAARRPSHFDVGRQAGFPLSNTPPRRTAAVECTSRPAYVGDFPIVSTGHHSSWVAKNARTGRFGRTCGVHCGAKGGAHFRRCLESVHTVLVINPGSQWVCV